MWEKIDIATFTNRNILARNFSCRALRAHHVERVRSPTGRADCNTLVIGIIPTWGHTILGIVAMISICATILVSGVGADGAKRQEGNSQHDNDAESRLLNLGRSG